MDFCNKCEKKICEPLVTAYGDKLCEDCWDDYLMTDEGKVEYFIGISNGDYPITDFDADFLGWVTVCWERNRYRLDMTMPEIARIEAKARKLDLI